MSLWKRIWEMPVGNLQVGSVWVGRRRRRSLLLCLVVGLMFSGLSTVRAQRGAVTLPRTLTDMSHLADRIVQGRVVSVRVEPHPDYKNLHTLLISLQVDDVLKGPVSKEFTFRQFVWDIRDISDGGGYRVGDEVLLFLNPATSLGLTSPVGLEQGRFRVVKSSTGETMAINGSGNSGLLQGLIASGRLNGSGLSAASQKTVRGFSEGPIPLSALKESTRVLLQSQARAR